MASVLVPPIAGAIPFVDTSDNNESDSHQIDWPTLARYLLSVHPEAGVVVKVSELDYVNKYLHRQRWGAHAAGLKNVGLYFYDRISATGAQNADLFFKAQGADGALVSGEFIAGDFEDTDAAPTADLDAHVLDALSRIEHALGIPPLIYTAAWYANPHNLNRDRALAHFPLWWASYQDTVPPVPEPWASAGKGIALWQFTSKAQLPGLPWECDVSWWLAGLPALRAIQWPQPDPIAGKPTIGTPDSDGDVPTLIKAAIADLEKTPPDVSTALADLARAMTRFGLLG